MTPSRFATHRSFVLLSRDIALYAIFTFTFGSGLFFAFSRPSDILSSAGNTMSQAFWFVVFASSVLLAALCRVKFLHVLRSVGWLLPLMVWIIISALWSTYPDLTLRRAGREEVELFSIVLLMCTYSRRTAPLRIIFLSFLTILAMDLASLLFPSFSYSSLPPGFMGIHGQKNIAGEFYFLAVPLFVLAVFDRTIAVRRYTAMLASICGSFLLLFSASKTAIGLLVVTTLCVVAMRALRRMGKYAGVLALIFFLIGTIAAVGVLGIGFTDTITYLTDDPTFTGRTFLWQYVLSRWEESPYLGHGFGALWQVGPQLEAHLRAGQLDWVVNEAHEGYLDMLAQIGIIGLFLLAIFLCAALPTVLFAREERSKALNAWNYYSIYVILGTLFYNFTESSLVRPGNGAWMLFVAIFATARLPGRYPTVSERPDRKTDYFAVSARALSQN